jgi:hypothetical protein
MLHPIYLALLRRPDLAADHLLAYADLLRLQTQILRRAVVGRSLAWLLTLVCALLSVFFAGTALMLALLLDRYHPVLVLLPGAWCLSALASLLLARRRLPARAYAQLREQIEQDLVALRSLSAKP